MNQAVTHTNIPGLPEPRRGKVRDIYDLGDQLLVVSTDRISAFDWVLPNGIPDKGCVLTRISKFWFDQIEQPHHCVSTNLDFILGYIPTNSVANIRLQDFAWRSMLVKKATPLPVECVVRGYITGSGWKDYQKTQSVCGVSLPKGLQESAELARPIFTPATKAQQGHDENIDMKTMIKILETECDWITNHDAAVELANQMGAQSLALYEKGRNLARERGIIIADTKFEWGWLDGELILIDEVLTPDSSRFWPLDGYKPGQSQPSYDKQFVRDYLTKTGWDKNSPPPALPVGIVANTRLKYIQAYEILTGTQFA